MRAVLQTVLMLTCCVSAISAQAQSDNQGNSSQSNPAVVTGNDGNNRDEPIRFETKARDACVMVVSGQRDFTKLRVSCKNEGKTYWCEFLGKPNLCRPYNTKPRHYFTQVMWEMRKLQNACQGPRAYKPQMCRSATDQAQMVLHKTGPKVQKQQHPNKPTKDGSKSVKKAASRPSQPRRNTKTTTARPTEAAQSSADQLAEEYCWKSVQGICSYLISWFQ